MTTADQMQVAVFREYLGEIRTCDNCKAKLSEHLPGEEHDTRPSLKFGSSCLNFTDPIQREAAEKNRKPRGVAPAGYVK